MGKFLVELVLRPNNTPVENIKAAVIEFAELVEITDCTVDDPENTGSIKISLTTHDPTVIFDACGQFGKIKNVKIEELKS